jgi:uncharacterized protein YciI
MMQNSIMKRFWVAFQFPIAAEDEMLKHMADHLRYMDANENGVFLSGPLLREGRTVDEGMTVLKTEDESEARAFMDAEPLIKAGVRRYELRMWRVQESSLTLTISGFHGTATLG